MDLKSLLAQTSKTTVAPPEPGKLLEVAKQRAPAPEKKPVRPARVEKNEEWVAHLTEKAKELDSSQFGGATVAFKVVKAKEKWTALTPYLVYPGGEEKRAPYRANAGFCTEKDYGPWLKKLLQICLDIHNTVPREKKAKGVSRSVSRWTEEIEKAKGVGTETQVVSGKLNVSKGDALVTFVKDKEGNVYVAKGKGDLDSVTEIIRAVSPIE